MTETRSQWQWRPDRRIWMLAAVLVPVLFGLGVWQLDRAAQKQSQAERWEQNPASWPPSNVMPGRPVVIEGRYDPEIIWLLDNRTRNGRRGYEVLHLFHSRSESPLVINRGWVAAPRERDELPSVAVPEGRHRVVARVSDWPEPLVLGEVNAINPDGWPRRVARLTPGIARETAPQAHRAMVRVADEQQPGALQTGWTSDRMGAATHYGYAAQWFALAVLLLSLTIGTSFRRNEEE